MNYLFIFNSPGILGGIETLIVRMSRWLTAQGNNVSLLVQSAEKWRQLLPGGIRIFELGERYRELYYCFHAMRLCKELKLERPDVIKSFDLPASWIACQIAAVSGKKCKVIAGIYNPAIFKWYYGPASARPWEARNFYLANYLRRIPPSARVFCGVDQIDELEETHQQKGIVWPLPIDTMQFEAACRKPKFGKIVSVGRLSPMKEYNLYMPDVIQELRKRGHDVSWSVYGTGEYEDLMREQIKKENLSGFIAMEGTISYKQFFKALADAYVFVGMGTAILEASLFKVPNVTAAAYDRDGLTWGPIYRLPRGSLSPSLTDPPRLRVVDEIERILKLSPAEYAAEEQRVAAHVQEHEVNASMQRLLDIIENAEHIKLNHVGYLANYPLGALRLMMRSDREVRHPELRQIMG